MNWRSSLFRFSYSYIVVALLHFPCVILIEDTLLCSGHVMKAFRFGVFEIGQIVPWRTCCSNCDFLRRRSACRCFSLGSDSIRATIAFGLFCRLSSHFSKKACHFMSSFSMESTSSLWSFTSRRLLRGACSNVGRPTDKLIHTHSLHIHGLNSSKVQIFYCQFAIFFCKPRILFPQPRIFVVRCCYCFQQSASMGTPPFAPYLHRCNQVINFARVVDQSSNDRERWVVTTGHPVLEGS